MIESLHHLSDTELSDRAGDLLLQLQHLQQEQARRARLREVAAQDVRAAAAEQELLTAAAWAREVGADRATAHRWLRAAGRVAPLPRGAWREITPPRRQRGRENG